MSSYQTKKGISSYLIEISDYINLIKLQNRQKLLIKLARVCLLFDQVSLCSQIIGFLKESDLVVRE